MKNILNQFEAFLLTEKCCSVNTFTAYKTDMQQLVKFLKNHNRSLEQCNEQDLQAFLKEYKKIVSTRSLARKISTFKIFFDWAHHKIGWQNLSLHLTIPRLEKTLPHCLTLEQIEELIAVAQKDETISGKRNYTMLYLLYCTGIRISELTHLTLAMVEISGQYLKVHGKGGKQRIVPLSSAGLKVLEVYINDIRPSITKSYNHIEYLFPVVYQGKLKPITRQAFWKILQDIAKKTSLKGKISPHILRHSLATHLLKNGAHLRSLQLLLGHETISTVQVYTHLDIAHIRSLYDKKHPRS